MLSDDATILNCDSLSGFFRQRKGIDSLLGVSCLTLFSGRNGEFTSPWRRKAASTKGRAPLGPTADRPQGRRYDAALIAGGRQDAAERVARTCSVDPRLFLVLLGRTSTLLENRGTTEQVRATLAWKGRSAGERPCRPALHWLLCTTIPPFVRSPRRFLWHGLPVRESVTARMAVPHCGCGSAALRYVAFLWYPHRRSSVRRNG